MVDLGSIATYAYDRIPNIDSTTSGLILEFASQAQLMCENMLGITIGSVNISTQYQSMLINLTSALTLSRMEQVGFNSSNWAIGELKVASDSNTPRARMIQFYLDMVKMDFNMLSSIPGRFSKSNG